MSDSNLNSIYPARHARLVAALQQAGLDALVLNAGPSLVYLTGLHFHLSERPVVAIFSFAAPLTIVTAVTSLARRGRSLRASALITSNSARETPLDASARSSW